MRIGDRIKFLLDINNMNNNELALAINVSPSTISRLINTHRIPKIKDIIYNISDYFRVHAEFLEDGELLHHDCLHTFKNADEYCPECGLELRDFIVPRLKFSRDNVGKELYKKLILLLQYSDFLAMIEHGVEMEIETRSISLDDMCKLEEKLLLKERVFLKFEQIKEECIELINYEDNDYPYELTLKDYVQETNWFDYEDKNGPVGDWDSIFRHRQLIISHLNEDGGMRKFDFPTNLNI